LLWLLVHRPVEGLAAAAQLEPADLEGLASGPIFAAAASLSHVSPEIAVGLLRGRLNDAEKGLLDRAAQPEIAIASSVDCVVALQRLRYERELAGIQQEIERLGHARRANDGDAALADLWARKTALLRRLEEHE